MALTEPYWQSFTPTPDCPAPPYASGHSVAVPGAGFLTLPLRILPSPEPRAVASLLVNHASFNVVDGICRAMAEIARPLAPDIVVGLPTLGLTLAPAVAQILGHPHYVPLGTSRKFWYRDDLGVAMSSITSPGQGKTLYLDPNLLPRLAGKRVLVIDDVVSRGTSMAAALSLLRKAGVEIAGVAVAMAQTQAWRDALPGVDVRAAFASPAFTQRDGGWWPVEA